MATADSSSPAVRRRRRGRRGVIALVVFIVVLAGAIVAAEFIARSLVAGQIESSVRSSLDIEESVDVGVDVHGFSVLQQLVVGELEHVSLTTDRVDLEGLVGTARIEARGVPIDTTMPVRSVDAVVSVDEDALQQVTADLTSLPIDSLGIADGQVTVAASLDVFGLAIPLGLGLIPEANGGSIDFTPTTVSVNGAEVGLAEVGQLFGSAASALTETRTFCIATSLPERVALENIVVGDGEIDIELSADGIVLTEQALAVTGTCPPA